MDERDEGGLDQRTLVFFPSLRQQVVCLQAHIRFNVSAFIPVQNRYDQTVGESNSWNLDMLCQKWQLRNEEIGMMISFADSSFYFYDIELSLLFWLTYSEFDDWGIEYHNISFQSSVPSEGEIINVIKVCLIIPLQCSSSTHSTKSILNY